MKRQQAKQVLENFIRRIVKKVLNEANITTAQQLYDEMDTADFIIGLEEAIINFGDSKLEDKWFAYSKRYFNQYGGEYYSDLTDSEEGIHKLNLLANVLVKLLKDFKIIDTGKSSIYDRFSLERI